jgi:hypothetical protein
LEIKIQLDFCNCGFILLDSKSSRHVVKFCIQFMQQREIHSLYMVNRVILHSDQSPTPTTLDKKNKTGKQYSCVVPLIQPRPSK